MIVGIVSDTHGFFHPDLPRYFAGVDLILHAGDIGSFEILEKLEEIAETKAVWGNIDGSEIRRRTSKHVRAAYSDVRIWMTHIGGRPGRWAKGVGPELKSNPPDVFICGHSHILRIERVKSHQGMLYLNPGAAGRQGFHRVKTCVKLYLENGNPVKADVIHLDKSAAEESIA